MGLPPPLVDHSRDTCSSLSLYWRDAEDAGDYALVTCSLAYVSPFPPNNNENNHALTNHSSVLIAVL